MKNQSYLIQRLKKPYGSDNPFSFGGGLKNGGLSEEAMGLLRGIFSFDYMGAAEFEFGAVPEALLEIAKGAGKGLYTAFQFPIDLNKIAKDWRDKSEEALEGSATIYVICNKDDMEEVEKRITLWASESYQKNMKETTRLNLALRPYNEWDTEIRGWLELDNGFFFFVDEMMWKRVAELFGIETSD